MCEYASGFAINANTTVVQCKNRLFKVDAQRSATVQFCTEMISFVQNIFVAFLTNLIMSRTSEDFTAWLMFNLGIVPLIQFGVWGV